MAAEFIVEYLNTHISHLNGGEEFTVEMLVEFSPRDTNTAHRPRPFHQISGTFLSGDETG